jgi:hypothetical protein
MMINEHILFGRADNTRVTGWDQVRDRLIGDDEPMLTSLIHATI